MRVGGGAGSGGGRGGMELTNQAKKGTSLGLTNDAAKQLAEGCPKLEGVSFHACMKLTDATAEHLSDCPQLKHVDFLCCFIGTKLEALRSASLLPPQISRVRSRLYRRRFVVTEA